MAKAILFDLDGTIVFSHPLHYEAYKVLFSTLGITEWTLEEFEKVFAGSGPINIIGSMLARHGKKADNLMELADRKRAIFNDLLQEKKLLTVPGFFDFFGLIKSRFAHAVASGSHRANIQSMLENIGLAEDFPVVVGGDEVPRMKPAPDIFLAAAERLGIDPRDCLIIEDTPVGVAAAVAAGIPAIALLTTSTRDKLLDAGAAHVCKDYTQIPKLPNILTHDNPH